MLCCLTPSCAAQLSPALAFLRASLSAPFQQDAATSSFPWHRRGQMSSRPSSGFPTSQGAQPGLSEGVQLSAPGVGSSLGGPFRLTAATPVVLRILFNSHQPIPLPVNHLFSILYIKCSVLKILCGFCLLTEQCSISRFLKFIPSDILGPIVLCCMDISWELSD